jgi:hypothetical protein
MKLGRLPYLSKGFSKVSISRIESHSDIRISTLLDSIQSCLIGLKINYAKIKVVYHLELLTFRQIYSLFEHQLQVSTVVAILYFLLK